MKPYFQDDAVQIYLGDCREILPQLPKVDLVLTDFPYGNGTEYGEYEDTQQELLNLINTTMPLILEVAKVSLIACGIGNMFLYPRPEWVSSIPWQQSAGAYRMVPSSAGGEGVPST